MERSFTIFLFFEKFFKEAANIMSVLFVCCFVQGTRPVNYARDNYWLSSIRLQQKIDEKSFTSIMEMRDAVANLHGIAQRSGMEKQVVDHWLDLLNFLNLLYQNIGNQPQGWALQQISEKWGTNCGISKKNKKLADKIIRDNLKNQVMVPGPVPYMNPPFIPMGNIMSAVPIQPTPFFPDQISGNQFSSMQGPMQQMQFQGICFNCNQTGHMARQCPFPQRTGRRNIRGTGRRANGLSRNQWKKKSD